MIKENTLRLFLILHAKLLVPPTTLDILAAEISNMSLNRENMVSRINDCNLADKAKVLELVEEDVLQDVLKLVRTKYARVNNIQSHFKYVVPVKSYLDKTKLDNV